MTDTCSMVSLVILTYNEERNLDVLLESVSGWAAAVYVVDSGSTDATVAIARRHGAHVVCQKLMTTMRVLNSAPMSRTRGLNSFPPCALTMTS